MTKEIQLEMIEGLQSMRYWIALTLFTAEGIRAIHSLPHDSDALTEETMGAVGETAAARSHEACEKLIAQVAAACTEPKELHRDAAEACLELSLDIIDDEVSLGDWLKE